MKQNKEEEIDLIKVFSKLWVSKILIFRFTVFFFILGIFVALITPNKFQSRVVFVPQLSNEAGNISGSLGSLASLAGIDLSGAMGSGLDIPTSIYPKIIYSQPFLKKLGSSEITFENSSITIRDYYLQNNRKSVIGILKKYTLGLPTLLKDFFKNEEIIQSNNESEIYFITENDRKFFEIVDEILTVNINKKDQYVELSVIDLNSHVSAQITHIAQKLLQEKIISYKIQAANEILIFTKNQYEIKKQEFENIQNKLASFKDSNLNIISSKFSIEQSRLESEFQIISIVLTELSKQYEQSKLRVSKNTPVFTIIEPVSVPKQRHSPRRTVMVLIWSFFGLFLSVTYILFKNSITSFFKLATSS